MTRKCHVRFGGGTVEKRTKCGSPLYLPYHDRQTKEGEQQLHTHVILPGLAPTVGGWEPMYINKRQGHNELFNDIAHQEFEQALDRTIGPEWRRLREEPEVTHDIPTDSEDPDVWFPR